jgi:hypothetical protein
MELHMDTTRTSRTSMTRIQCQVCQHFIDHNPRQITGCNCDPDAPYWCYIDRDGTAKGWSQARWKIISTHENR